MPILARYLAVAACLTLVGSAADAAPKKHRKRPKLTHEVTAVADDIELLSNEEEEEEEEEEEAEEEAQEADDEQPLEKPARKRKRQAFEDGERVDSELVDAPVAVGKKARGLREWHLGVGPNMWLASVKANVAVGAKDVGAAIDFLQISKYTKFALPLLVEGRYKRFSFVGDLTYAVIGLQGGNEVGPLMVTLDGNVSSLQFDGLAGVRVWGNESSKVSVEARAGVRYQRMVISGSLNLSGNELAPREIVDGSTDVLAGARLFVKPFSRLFASAAVDQSVFGTSTSTYSIGADANVRITGRVLLSAGWKTMTQQKGAMATTMYGPKLSLQVLF